MVQYSRYYRQKKEDGTFSDPVYFGSSSPFVAVYDLARNKETLQDRLDRTENQINDLKQGIEWVIL